MLYSFSLINTILFYLEVFKFLLTSCHNALCRRMLLNTQVFFNTRYIGIGRTESAKTVSRNCYI